jgi:hypothetical protein
MCLKQWIDEEMHLLKWIERIVTMLIHDSKYVRQLDDSSSRFHISYGPL